MKAKILVSMILSLFCIMVFSQNLDKMPVEERNALLIEIARNTVKKYAPGYYREYGEPIIERRAIEANCELYAIDKEAGIRPGRVRYRVTFPYDESKEFFMYGFSAEVDIWADNGKPYTIMGGHGFGKRIKQKRKKSDGEHIDTVHYKKLERPKTFFLHKSE